MRSKFLLVSFPVDLGNRVLARNLLQMLKVGADVEHFEFDAGVTADTSIASGSLERNIRRASYIVPLAKALRRAGREGRIVVFQQITPAVFSLPFISGLKTFVLLDWTKKLYEPLLGRSMSSPAATSVHRVVLKTVTGIMALTEAAETSVRNDYDIDPLKIVRVPMPFDHRSFAIAPQRNGALRVLFVGADFNRKGGDLVVDWFKQYRSDAVLTIVTQADIARPDGVTVIRNRPGEDLSQIYSANDILALPSRCDAYPQVLGEAASAGLAIATMSTALGSPEIVIPGWNGFIGHSAADFADELGRLVANRDTVERFKRHSRQRIEEGFSFEKVYEEIAHAVQRLTTDAGRPGR